MMSRNTCSIRSHTFVVEASADPNCFKEASKTWHDILFASADDNVKHSTPRILRTWQTLLNVEENPTVKHYKKEILKMETDTKAGISRKIVQMFITTKESLQTKELIDVEMINLINAALRYDMQCATLSTQDELSLPCTTELNWLYWKRNYSKRLWDV